MRLLAVVVWAALPAVACAGMFGGGRPGTKRVEVIPYAGFRFGGSFENELTGDSVSARPSPAYGLAIDISPEGGPEKLQLAWSRQETELAYTGLFGRPDELDLTIDYFHIGGLLEYPGREFIPYVSVTLGATHIDVRGAGSDTWLSIGIGGGFKYFPGRQKTLAIRGDVRAYGTAVESGGAILCSGGRCVIAYSGSGFWQGEATLGLVLAF